MVRQELENVGRGFFGSYQTFVEVSKMRQTPLRKPAAHLLTDGSKPLSLEIITDLWMAKYVILARCTSPNTKRRSGSSIRSGATVSFVG